jgi:transketolase
MRKRCLEMVYELAKQDNRVIFIGSDLSPGLLQEFKDEFPDRYFMEGIAEANIFGMAAGFAMEGFIPYVNTIGTFITRRSYEQIAIDACLHNLPVRMIGNGGGFVYAPLGPTHQATEDFATMRALPNMTVTAVCDADEMSRLMLASLNWPQPIYIRLGKGGDPIVSDGDTKFVIGKAIELRSPPQPRVGILTTGIMARKSLDAASILTSQGIEASVTHFHTIKPIDDEKIIDIANKVEFVVTVEEHSIVGGFGSAVAEVLVDANLSTLPKIIRMGIPDEFSDNYGSQDELLNFYGLSADGIVSRVNSNLRAS